jgi:hypothetical protein
MGLQVGQTTDPEVEELLVRLVDASMTVARPQRQFFVSRAFGVGVTVQGAGLEGELAVAPQDLSELDRSNLIKIMNVNVRGTYEFFITTEGYNHVQRIKNRINPITAAGKTAVDYIDSADFASRHPIAGSWPQECRSRHERAAKLSRNDRGYRRCQPRALQRL